MAWTIYQLVTGSSCFLQACLTDPKPLDRSIVARQWKSASIQPEPKIATPLEHSDYRPISIIPVLSRTLEDIIVREYFFIPLFSYLLLLL